MADKLPVVAGETIVKATVAILIPYGGVANLVWDGIRKSVAARAEKTISEILAEVDPDVLAARCAESSEFEAVIVNALDAAARTGYEAKRRLLGRVVINAASDDARVDDGTLIVQALRDLDGPHIRALERIRRAEDDYVLTDQDRLDLQKYRPEDRTEQAQSKISDAGVRAGLGEKEAVRAVLKHVGAIGLAGMYAGDQSGGSITSFGRQLLAELTRMSEAE